MNVDMVNEANISKKPALEVLQKLGYQYISSIEAERMRESLSNVILTDILRSQLQKLNKYEYKDVEYDFSPSNIGQAMKDLDALLIDGLVKTNEKIYDMLLLGKSYSEKLIDGSTKSFSLKFIDWDNYENNVFHVVEEFRVLREDGKGVLIPDIVLFVNGIPFGVIECKKASVSVEDGISQLIYYQNSNHIPNLFKFSQILMAANSCEVKYATCNTPRKYWVTWKEEEIEWLEDKLSKTVIDRIPTVQDKDIISLFEPSRLLDFTKYFVLYDKNVKKIARYQQFFAVK